MLESFRSEWQQSSAEVREVQDFIIKKDAKPSAAAAAAVAGVVDSTITNGSVPAQSAGGGGGGGGGRNDADNVAQSTAGSAPQSVGGGASPSPDGAVEHRPHAASAATVGGGGAPGGAGAGTATVEDIVRGVPSEMVVPTPTTTCVGPTGADGSCRGEVLADKATAAGAGAGAGAGVAGSAASLGSEIPHLGGAGAPGAGGRDDGPNVDGAGEGLAVDAEEYRGGSGDDAAKASIDDAGRPPRGSEGATGGGGSRRDGDAAKPADGQQQNPPATGESRDGTIDGSVAAAADAGAGVAAAKAPDGAGNGVTEDGGVATGDGRDDVQAGAGAGDEEPQPARKGIIHSTMEAISKAVNRGEPSKLKDGSAAKPGEVAGETGGDGVAAGTPVSSGGGSAEGRENRGDEDAGPLPSELPASAQATDSAGPVRDGEIEVLAGDDDGAGRPDASTVGAASGTPVGGEPPATGGSDSSRTGEGQESPDASPGSEGKDPPPHRPGDETIDSDGQRDQAGATDGSRERHGDGAVGGSGGGGTEDSVIPLDARPEDSGDQRPGSAAAEEPTLEEERLAAAAAAAGGAASPQSPGASGAGQHRQADSVSSGAEGVGAGAGAGGEPALTAAAPPPQGTRGDSLGQHGSVGLASTAHQAHGDVSAAAALSGGGSRVADPPLPVVLVEETNAATLTAACLNALSFSEFRDEVLARTQQAQQSAGGGVAIGGQYESIFKTLMNKIKTLEINQSLYSLYIGASWFWL